MSIFREFFKTQSDSIFIHQNALICTKFLKFLGELAYPPEQLNLFVWIWLGFLYVQL